MRNEVKQPVKRQVIHYHKWEYVKFPEGNGRRCVICSKEQVIDTRIIHFITGGKHGSPEIG